MFIGHISIALLFSAYTQFPLGSGIFFTLLPDTLFFAFCALGIEKSVLDWDYDFENILFPYRLLTSLSHTVLGAFVYAIGCVVLLAFVNFILKEYVLGGNSKIGQQLRKLLCLPKISQKNATICVFLTISHILLDILVHPHENIQLVPYSFDYPLGIGLWRWGGRLFHCAIEIGMLLFGTIVYARHTESITPLNSKRIKGKIHWSFVFLILFLIGLEIGVALLPARTLSVFNLFLLISTFLFIQIWGAWIDYQREERFGIAISRYL